MLVYDQAPVRPPRESLVYAPQSRLSATDMEVLKMVFDELGMTQYLPRFIGNGFETWEDVLEITEIDLYDFNFLPVAYKC